MKRAFNSVPRQVKASVLVLAPLALLGLVSLCPYAAQGVSTPGSIGFTGEAIARHLANDDATDTTINTLLGLKSVDQSSVLSLIEEEAGSLGKPDELWIDEEAHLLGFSLNDPIEQAWNQCSQMLNEKGWTVTASKEAYTLSAIKSEGKLGWILVSFTEFDSSTTVVLQWSENRKG